MAIEGLAIGVQDVLGIGVRVRRRGQILVAGRSNDGTSTRIAAGGSREISL